MNFIHNTSFFAHAEWEGVCLSGLLKTLAKTQFASLSLHKVMHTHPLICAHQ